MGIAGVRLAHSLSFGLQVVARDLQFLHKLFDIRDGRRSCGRESSVEESAQSDGLLLRTSSRMPPSSISIAESDDFDFATSIGFPIRCPASQINFGAAG